MNLIKTSYGWLDITTGIEYVTENEYYENMEENKKMISIVVTLSKSIEPINSQMAISQKQAKITTT